MSESRPSSAPSSVHPAHTRGADAPAADPQEERLKDTPPDNVSVAVAHPNIALIKYWGKRDGEYNLPVTGSLSLTLDNLSTRTRVALDPDASDDRFFLNGEEDTLRLPRVSETLERIRRHAGHHQHAVVRSQNDFPTAAGLASSASGFAALVTAACAAYGVRADMPLRGQWARRGSGSAARSLFGGFVRMDRGTAPDGSDAVARQIATPDHWPLRVVVAITSTRQKAAGSTEGMRSSAATSPYFQAWMSDNESLLDPAQAAVEARDFDALAELSEQSCLRMHAVMMSGVPGLLYWRGATVNCLQLIRNLRREDHVPVFFTVDAGPQVKAICLPEAASQVATALAAVPGVVEVMEAGLGEGARLQAP